MQGAIAVGKTEMECYTPPATETLFEMVQEMPGWRPRGGDDTGFIAMFVAGRSTAMPHGFVKGHGIQLGDVLVSGAGASIDGYRSELERTMIVGEPTAAQEKAFVNAGYRIITGDYFRAVGQRMLAGRAFTTADRAVASDGG